MPDVTAAEQPLGGGDVTAGVVRVGSTVRRPRQPQSDSVAAYLRHLEGVGFDGAPRWHGVDEKARDILDFIEGEVPGSPPAPWTAADAVLVDVAVLLRRLHDASEGFVPPNGAAWFGDDLELALPDDARIDDPPELVAHLDVTPQNVVFRQRRPVALIDFDMAHPATRLLDVINTAMHWVPLRHPDDRGDIHARADVPARLRLFVDAYGLTDPERRRFLDVAARAFRRSWFRMQANALTRGGGWARMWNEGVGDAIVRRQRWLAAEHAALEEALLG